jgi:cell division protease FtsH
MADELGPAYFGGSGDGSLGGGGYNPFQPKEYSDETGHLIDRAVLGLLGRAHERAHEAITKNRAALDAIAAALMQDETLDRDQFTAIAREHGALPQPQSSLPSPAA